MIDSKQCVRCGKEVNVFFDAFDALDFERYLSIEGLKVKEDDVLCQECCINVVDSNEL